MIISGAPISSIPLSSAPIQLGGGNVVFDNITRRILVSGKSSAKLVVSGVTRRNLVSSHSTGGAKLVFSSVTRKTLGLFVPSAPLNSSGPIPVFPTLPQGYPIKVSPVLDTTLGTTKSLREMRVAQQTYPIWDIEILFEQLKDQTQNQTPYVPFTGYTQYMQLVQLWLMMYGQAGVFYFTCPWDYSRSNQAFGTGDGNTIAFTVYRTWGLGAQATVAPVGGINAVNTLYVNGVAQSPSSYSVQRNKIVFNNPPAAGATLSLTFTYYYVCRFTEDDQDYEEFAKNRWSVQSLKFRASPW